MIRIGAEVKPGDILIGKLLKGESDPTPENFVQSSGIKQVIKDASLKRLLLYGVVLTKIVRKSGKDKRKRTQDKDALGALEMEFEVKFVELKTN
jgi:DNA-directed RNA polymerase subunit beta